MDYKHILVAVDLSSSSKEVIAKAVSLAKSKDALLSFIFVDIDSATNAFSSHPEIDYVIPIEDHTEEYQHQLLKLANEADYPIENSVVVMGDFRTQIVEKVNEMGIDLIICGHHHDFWSRFFSVSRKLIDSVTTDVLFVHLEDQ